MASSAWFPPLCEMFWAVHRYTQVSQPGTSGYRDLLVPLARSAQEAFLVVFYSHADPKWAQFTSLQE